MWIMPWVVMVVPGCHIDEERVEVLSELTLGGEYIMEGKGARRFHSPLNNILSYLNC
jgi:hypothetical protein